MCYTGTCPYEAGHVPPDAWCSDEEEIVDEPKDESFRRINELTAEINQYRRET